MPPPRLRWSLLAAAIAVSVVRFHTVATQLWQMASPGFSAPLWMAVCCLSAQLLALAPLPFALVELYRSRAAVMLSAPMRRLAAVVAALLFLYAAPFIYLWIGGSVERVQDALFEIRSFGEASLAANTWAWLRGPGWRSLIYGPQLWTIVLSQLAFVTFLAALCRYGSAAQGGEWRRSVLVRESAAFATVAAGLMIVVDIGRLALAPGDLPRLFLSISINLVPQVCWMLGAYVVFRSQDEPPAADEPSPSEMPLTT